MCQYTPYSHVCMCIVSYQPIISVPAVRSTVTLFQLLPRAGYSAGWSAIGLLTAELTELTS